MIHLIDVYSMYRLTADTVLWALLEQRKPWQSISHKKMPTIEEHIAFVASKPYKHWYIICRQMTGESRGAVYITHENEIGLFIFDEYHHQGYGKIALDQIMKKHKEIDVFRANIAPLNSASMAFFTNFGFKYGYRMDRKDPDTGQTEIVQHTLLMANPYYASPDLVLPSAHRQST